jgi:hypothetical protein
MTAFAFLLLVIIFFLHYRVGPYMKAKLSFLELHAEQDKICQGRRAQACLDISYLRSISFLDFFLWGGNA